MVKLNRQERMVQIVRCVEGMQRWIGCDGFTATQIAHWVSMEPSSHLRGILRSCVVAGFLDEAEKEHRPGIRMSVYSITEQGREFVREYLSITRIYL